jgi:hypothetical protein
VAEWGNANAFMKAQESLTANILRGRGTLLLLETKCVAFLRKVVIPLFDK